MGQGRRSGKTSSSEGKNLVTILFVLGVIGWGFFAIDRLTETDSGGRTRAMQGRASGQEAGWKKDLRDWLNRKLAAAPVNETRRTNETIRNTSAEATSTDVPLLAEPSGLIRESLGDEKSDGGVYLYRLNSKGKPVLTRVKRERPHEVGNLASYLNEVIRGPSEAELELDFVDSFIHKPKILRVKTEGSCVIIDFDRKFGAGVSHQTLRYQLRQIFKNIQQVKQVDCMQILISGKHQEHLGTDGIYVPERIDGAWFKENP